MIEDEFGRITFLDRQDYNQRVMIANTLLVPTYRYLICIICHRKCHRKNAIFKNGMVKNTPIITPLLFFNCIDAIDHRQGILLR